VSVLLGHATKIHRVPVKVSQYNVNVNVVYTLKQKFSEEGVGLCEEMSLKPISELFTTDSVERTYFC